MRKISLRRIKGSSVSVDADASELEILEPLDSFRALTDDLSQLRSLRSLALKAPFGKIDSLDFLTAVPLLERLDIRARPLDKIKNSRGLSALKRLKELTINDYASLDLQELSTTRLLRLSLYVPNTKNVEWLFGQKQLRRLFLRQYRSSTMREFEELQTLEELRIRGGRIVGLAGMVALQRLRQLELVFVGLRSAKELVKLRQLESLDLSSNKQLQDISFVKALHKLRTFRFLEIPRVSSFKPLTGLSLEVLEISSVPLDEDITPLRSLKVLKERYFHRSVTAKLDENASIPQSDATAKLPKRRRN